MTGLVHDGHIEIMPFDACEIDVEATPGASSSTTSTCGTATCAPCCRAPLTAYACSPAASGSLSTTSGHCRLNGAGLRLKGRATGTAELSGPLEALSARGRVVAEDLELGPALTPYIVASLDIDDVLGSPAFAGAVAGDSLRLGGVPLGNYRAFGEIGAAGARLDTFMCAHGDTVGLLRLNVAFSDTVDRYVIEEFRVDMEGTRWALDRPLGLGLGDGYLSVRDLSLSSDQGAVTGGGVLDRRRLVAGALQLRQFDLGLLNPFVTVREPLTGRLTADVVLGGEPDAVQVNLSADLVEAPFAIADVESLHVEAVYERGPSTSGPLTCVRSTDV